MTSASYGGGRGGPAGADRFADWDAAYVLGALSPAERLEFERHLSTCPECSRAVTELAGMPGLLARVPLQEALSLADPHADPVVPPERRRPLALSKWLVGLAAVLVLLAGFGGGYALRALTTPDPSRVAFSAVEPSELTAVADLVQGPDGTDVEVECQYGQQPAGYQPTYAIWVIDRRGRETQIKDWQVKTNKVMHPSGDTPLSIRQLSTIEIRDAHSGTVLLRANLR